MSFRRPRTPIIALGCSLVLAATLTSCAPAPEPLPTPTAAFASEEGAFTAAEEVYRAYNAAGNAARVDPEAADPQEYLIGAALDGYLEAEEYLRSLDMTLVGETKISAFIGTDATLNPGEATVTATVCLDVSGTRAVDSTGADVTPSTRAPILAQEVVMIANERAFLISSEQQGDVTLCG